MKTIFDELQQEVKNWWISLILGILYVIAVSYTHLKPLQASIPSTIFSKIFFMLPIDFCMQRNGPDVKVVWLTFERNVSKVLQNYYNDSKHIPLSLIHIFVNIFRVSPNSTAKVEELIHELKKQYTIVIVTHNMQQAARVSDNTAFFYICLLYTSSRE